MGLHWSGEVTLGNLLSIATFGGLALLAWRDLDWRVRNVETWKEGHLHSVEEQVRNISMLREAIVGIKQLAEGQDRRIQMLEDRRNDHGRAH